MNKQHKKPRCDDMYRAILTLKTVDACTQFFDDLCTVTELQAMEPVSYTHLIKVNRVELKNILPPQDIQNSMEKQMKAERDRRQAILQAEGQKKSAILIAEGEKESAILRADAEKQAAILKAEGEAEAIRKVQQALADSLEMLNKSAPSDQVIKLKSIEAMQKVADGKATKIIIPSEMQGLVGLANGIVEGTKE